MRSAEERLCSRCKKKKFLASGVELCSSCIVAEAEGEPITLKGQLVVNPIGMVIVKSQRRGGAGVACYPGKRPVKLRESEK